jgi:nucleoside-diphosphate-sugar epimerase
MEGAVAVTGASGFVGRYLVPALLERGAAVRATVRSRSRGRELEAAGATVVEADLLEPPSLVRALKGCRTVVHLAAVADSSDETLNRRVNVGGSESLAEACVQCGVERIVNFSSTCAGRELQDAYGRTKREAEAAFEREGLRVTHLRPTMIYGHGSKEFDLFARVVARAPRVPIPGHGKHLLRPVFVHDLTDLVLRVLERDVTVGRTYDVAGPRPLSFDDFIHVLGRAQGRSVRPLHVPAPLALAGARLLGRIQRHPFINVDQVMAFLQDTVVDIAPARRDLEWEPRPLERGLDELFGGSR